MENRSKHVLFKDKKVFLFLSIVSSLLLYRPFGKIKTVIRQIICIKQNPCKVPLHIILNKPAIKIIVVLYLAIIFLTAGCFIIICKGILQRICFITVFFFYHVLKIGRRRSHKMRILTPQHVLLREPNQAKTVRTVRQPRRERRSAM